MTAIDGIHATRVANSYAMPGVAQPSSLPCRVLGRYRAPLCPPAPAADGRIVRHRELLWVTAIRNTPSVQRKKAGLRSAWLLLA